MTQDPKDAVGQVIASRYELLEAIGRGGHGVVWRARDKTEGQLVAVKLLNDVTSRDPQYAERLAREQQAMLALAGTSAVALLDMCRANNGALCLVMELLEGVDLEGRFEQLEQADERMPIDELVALLDPIVATLERAHEAGIIHRDIKPANIFLLSDGGVRLLDFGLARLKEAQPLTAIGTIMGSPSYIAPEVWKGQPQLIDSRADVYSLGVIAFRALSGRLPFGGNSLFDKYVQATSAPRPSLHALRPDLLPEVDAWVREALAVDPAARFATSRRLWEALLAALRHSVPPQRTEQAPDGISAARAFVDAAKPRVVAAWQAAARAVRRWTSAESEPSSNLTEPASGVPPPSAPRPATEPPAPLPEHPSAVSPTKTVVATPEEPAEPKTLLYVPGTRTGVTPKGAAVAPARRAPRLPKLPVPPAPRSAAPDAQTLLKASHAQAAPLGAARAVQHAATDVKRDAPANPAPTKTATVVHRRPKLPNLPPPPRPAATAPSSPAPAVQQPAQRSGATQGTGQRPAQPPEAPTLLKHPVEARPSVSSARSPTGDTEALTLLKHPAEARPSTSPASPPGQSAAGGARKLAGEGSAPKAEPAPQPATPVAQAEPARAAAAQPARTEKPRATRRSAPKNERAKVPASTVSSGKRQRTSPSRKGKTRGKGRKRGSGKKR